MPLLTRGLSIVSKVTPLLTQDTQPQSGVMPLPARGLSIKVTPLLTQVDPAPVPGHVAADPGAQYRV